MWYFVFLLKPLAVSSHVATEPLISRRKALRPHEGQDLGVSTGGARPGPSLFSETLSLVLPGKGEPWAHHPRRFWGAQGACVSFSNLVHLE